MSKILKAIVEGGVVKVGSLVIDAEIFSQGASSSSGLLFIQGEQAYYFPNVTDDLKSTLEQVIDALTAAAAALNQVVAVNTAIGAGMTGPTTAPPPTLAVDLAVITTKAAEITTAKTALNALKGSLK